MVRVLSRLVADSALVAFILFVSAGTLTWWRAWVLVATLQVVRTVTAVIVYRVNPTLLQERARLPLRADQPWSDKLLLVAVLNYGAVRHPFYAGTLLVLVGLALWLESYTASLVAVVPITFIGVRIKWEERFLRRRLSGYDEYTVRVPHRLIPGIW